jgi:hypothetical protein
MKILILLPLIALTACGHGRPPEQVYIPPPPLYTVAPTPPSPPPVIYKLKGYDGPEAMEQHEVRQAQKLCIMSKMQPVTHFVSVRTDVGSKVQVPVSVTCEPF